MVRRSATAATTVTSRSNPRASPALTGRSTVRRHSSLSSSGASRMNRSRLCRSPRWFWMGVPVRAQRERACSSHTALVWPAFGFFTLCASSRTTLSHGTAPSAKCVLASTSAAPGRHPPSFHSESNVP